MSRFMERRGMTVRSCGSRNGDCLFKCFEEAGVCSSVRQARRLCSKRAKGKLGERMLLAYRSREEDEHKYGEDGMLDVVLKDPKSKEERAAITAVFGFAVGTRKELAKWIKT